MIDLLMAGSLVWKAEVLPVLGGIRSPSDSLLSYCGCSGHVRLAFLYLSIYLTYLG